MNREDMLRALDLDATPVTAASAVKIESRSSGQPQTTQGDNAMVLDRWTRRQGRQIKSRLDDERARIMSGRPIHDMNAIDLADLHHSVFDPSPALAPKETCADTQKWNYFQELNDTPGFHELRQSTVLDDAATELAIERLSEGLGMLRKNKEEDKDGFGTGRAAGNAVNQANQDVNDLNDARDGLGLGRESGAGGQYDVKTTLDLYKKLRQSSDLQKIINLAGKYRLFGQSQQRRKVAHGYDDMVGVTIGNSLPHLTQSEFLALGIPELEDEVCRRLLDSQAMVQEWRGNEPVAKGPMIIAIDESSSMTTPGPDGLARIQHAKAIALSFAYVARQQNRWCGLVAWASSYQRRSIVLVPGKWDHEGLIAWLSGFLMGGTEPPVSDMPTIYDAIGAPVGKTDICYITDGQVYIDPATVDAYNVWKEKVNAKVISLIVGSEPGTMNMISNETHCIRSFGFNEGTAAVLSI